MDASKNPFGNQHQEKSFFNGGCVASTSNLSNGNTGSGSGHGNSGTVSVMMHDPGIATEWTSEEQAILDEALSKCTSGSEPSVARYAKIAMLLPNKTVRDVALRSKWTSTKKEVSKRRKEDRTRKSKDKREKVVNPLSNTSQLASQPAALPYSMPLASLDNEDGIYIKAIGGPSGELLEQNAQLFNKITANINSVQIQDNIRLFCQARDNINKIMNSINDTPEIMKQMPPLPVKLNEELANAILPPTTHQMQS